MSYTPNGSLHVKHKLQFEQQRKDFLASLELNLFGIATVIGCAFDLFNKTVPATAPRVSEFQDNMNKFRALWYNYGSDWNEQFYTSDVFQKIKVNQFKPATLITSAPSWIQQDYLYFVQFTNTLGYDDFSLSLDKGQYPATLTKEQFAALNRLVQSMYGTFDFCDPFIKLCLNTIKLKSSKKLVVQRQNDPVVIKSYEPDTYTAKVSTTGGIDRYNIVGPTGVKRIEGRIGTQVQYQAFQKVFTLADGSPLRFYVPSVGTPPPEIFANYRSLPIPQRKVNDNLVSEGTEQTKPGTLVEDAKPKVETTSNTGTVIVGGALAFLLLA
jgi:hypothetical protein